MTASPTVPVRLQPTDDGRALLLPLTAVGEAPPEVLTLPEPSMEQMALIYDLVLDADKALDDQATPLPEIGPALQYRLDALNRDPANALPLTEADYVLLHERQEAAKDRRRVQFSKDSPHGAATAQIASLLTGREVTASMLPGWTMDPRVCAQILARFTAPFVGPDEEQLAAALTAALAGSAPS